MKALTNKVLILLLLLTVSDSVALPLPEVSTPVFADSEAYAEGAIVQPLLAGGDFVLHMKIKNAGSNLVQVAFGTDADNNGSLSPDEASWVVGYACGSVFIRSNDLQTRTEFPVGEQLPYGGGYSFDWLMLRVRLDPGTRAPHAISFNNNTIRDTDEIWESVIAGFAPDAWDMVRVTTRGGSVSVPQYEFHASPEATVILVK